MMQGQASSHEQYLPDLNPIRYCLTKNHQNGNRYEDVVLNDNANGNYKDFYDDDDIYYSDSEDDEQNHGNTSSSSPPASPAKSLSPTSASTLYWNENNDDDYKDYYDDDDIYYSDNEDDENIHLTSSSSWQSLSSSTPPHSQPSASPTSSLLEKTSPSPSSPEQILSPSAQSQPLSSTKPGSGTSKTSLIMLVQQQNNEQDDALKIIDKMTGTVNCTRHLKIWQQNHCLTILHQNYLSLYNYSKHLFLIRKNHVNGKMYLKNDQRSVPQMCLKNVPYICLKMCLKKFVKNGSQKRPVVYTIRLAIQGCAVLYSAVQCYTVLCALPCSAFMVMSAVLLCAVCSVQCAPCTVRCAVCNVQCGLCALLWALLYWEYSV